MVIDIGGGPVGEAVSYYRSVGGGDYPYAEDQGFRVARDYKVLGLGTTVILDQRGVVTFRDSGPTPTAILEREIGRALG